MKMPDRLKDFSAELKRKIRDLPECLRAYHKNIRAEAVSRRPGILSAYPQPASFCRAARAKPSRTRFPESSQCFHWSIKLKPVMTSPRISPINPCIHRYTDGRLHLSFNI